MHMSPAVSYSVAGGLVLRLFGMGLQEDFWSTTPTCHAVAMQGLHPMLGATHRQLHADGAAFLAGRGAGEIKLHPWFLGLDWTSLARTKAAFVPSVDDELDTSYFHPKSVRLTLLTAAAWSLLHRRRVTWLLSPAGGF